MNFLRFGVLILSHIFNKACYIWLVALVIGTAISCSIDKNKTNWQVNFNSNSKQPSGLYLYYNQLQNIFPDANISKLRKGYDFTKLHNKYSESGSSLLIFTGVQLSFSEAELEELLYFVKNGNELFISVKNIDEKILNYLKIEQVNTHYWSYYYDTIFKDSVKYYSVLDNQKNIKNYTFKSGYLISNYFKQAREESKIIPAIYPLGYINNNPNFIVYQVGDGKIYLHAEPILFSNVNLLQENNRNYISNIFSYINKDVEDIYFISFDYRIGTTSLWNILTSNKETKVSLILTLLLFVIFILFSIKRKQSIIPIIKSTKNESAKFVETVGQLYYNSGNHTNIAQKICTHFLDKVKNDYNMNINILDKNFISKLSIKSGNSEASVNELIYLVKCIKDGIPVDENILANLNHKIQAFNNGK